MPSPPLVRVLSAGDARRSTLRLSDSGASLMERARNHKHALLAEPFGDGSGEDLEDFARLLTRFSSISCPDGRR